MSRTGCSKVSFSVINLLLLAALAGGITLLALPADQQPLEPEFSTTPEHQQAQAEIATVGAGLVAWLTDQVGRPAGSSATVSSACGSYDVVVLPTVTHATIEALLVPDYLSAVPELDPWGNPYEFRLNGTLFQPDFATIRSAGFDGLFEGTSYLGGDTSGPSGDLVWVNFGWLRRLPVGGEVQRQTRAREDLHNLGTAMFSWLIDQISRPSASAVEFEEGLSVTARPSGGVDMADYQEIDHLDLAALLVPQYISCVPELDPWGGAYDYRLNDNLLGSEVMAIRTAGRDGAYETDVYSVGSFPADEFGRDLVWADGSFVVFPDGVHDSLLVDGFEGGLWGVWSTLP